ncbi:MAG: SDR family NAD(P)-dependent oxidoreductase [Candidatus Omnitrophica bacterium]|nr:SDR family NAD(P)-dependent oxidoreductase [Candidatus Omnitrophota bacterium]
MEHKRLRMYKPGQSRLALITGGTGSLGAASVRMFVEKGWNVAFQYFKNEKKAKALVSEISGKDVKIKAFKCDLAAGKEKIKSFISSVEKSFKNIDVVLHCAAPSLEVSTFDSEGAEAFKKLNELNVEAFVKLVGCCLTEMKYRQSGVIIGILTEAVLQSGIPAWSAYTASKFALASYLRDLALYVENMGIRVIGILPGAFKLDSLSASKSIWPEEVLKAIKLKWPMGVRPEDVARLIVEVCEDKARYKNKSFIAINAQDGVRDLSRFGFFPVSAEGGAKAKDVVVISESKESISYQESDGQLRQELEYVFREVFKLGRDERVDDAQLGSWGSWDSLRHFELLMAVESAMGINFLDTDVPAVTSFEKMLDVVRRLKR